VYFGPTPEMYELQGQSLAKAGCTPFPDTEIRKLVIYFRKVALPALVHLGEVEYFVYTLVKSQD
jgi:hypothetical protein